MFATGPQLAGALLDRAHDLGSAPPSWRAMKVYDGRELRRSMLTCLYLAVAVALQREHDASSDLDAGLIPVTIPELLRLLRGIVILWTTRTRSVRPTMARTKRIALASRRSRHTADHAIPGHPAVGITTMAAARSPHRLPRA